MDTTRIPAGEHEEYDLWRYHWLFDNATQALESRIIITMVPATREPDLIAMHRGILADELKTLRSTYNNQMLSEDRIIMRGQAGTRDIQLPLR